MKHPVVDPGRTIGCVPVWVGFETLESRTFLAVHTPTTAAQFQTALNAAALGDDIILQAGTTYVGQFTLPNKTSGSGWITIKSSNLSSLPGEGVRVSPADAVNMARLQSQGGNASPPTPPASGIPEPSAALLVFAAPLATLARRRRVG
ncbi:MAG: hypothetical protein WBD40_03020 [Tepidisphaeraceae bacterium]